MSGRFGTTAKVGALLGAIALVGVLGWVAWAYFVPKSQPDVDVANKYLSGYRDVNLALVKSSVSGDLIEGLPGSQAAFSDIIAKSPGGRVKSWTIKSVDRNDYVGQTMVDVMLTTTKNQKFTVELDIIKFSEGYRVRSAQDAKNPSKPTGTAGIGTTSTPSGMGVTGGTGMPTVQGHL